MLGALLGTVISVISETQRGDHKSQSSADSDWLSCCTENECSLDQVSLITRCDSGEVISMSMIDMFFQAD